MAPSRERVLVTGAGGFIGAHLTAEQARRGRTVVALDVDLDRVRHLAAPGRVELLEGDVTDGSVQRRAVREVEVIFHLAALHRSTRAGTREHHRVNATAVGTLAEAAAKAGVRRFVHCSSVGVFGRITDPPANEETPCHPQSAYERSKAAGEASLRETLVGNRRLEGVILRPAWVYGPGCPRTEKLFRAIGRSRFLMAGRGEGLRHCVYIRDMVKAFHLASVVPEAAGEVLIIGDAAAVRVRELLREIAALTGARPPRSIPIWFFATAGTAAELAWRVLPGEPPLSRSTVKFFTANTSFDIDRARRVLGYEPAYDVARGLRETFAILRSSSSRPVPLPLAPAP